MLFDSTNLIIIVPVNSPSGVRQVKVRWPTDPEWTLWRWEKPLLRKDLGRGKVHNQHTACVQADIDLLAAIRVDQDVELNNAEIWSIIKRLIELEVENPQWDSSQNAFRIGLQVAMCKIRTEHVLRRPTSDEIAIVAHQGFSSKSSTHGFRAIRINFDTHGELYDRMVKETTGYAAAVPVLHKAEVVRSVITAAVGEGISGR